MFDCCHLVPSPEDVLLSAISRASRFWRRHVLGLMIAMVLKDGAKPCRGQVLLLHKQYHFLQYLGASTIVLGIVLDKAMALGRCTGPRGKCSAHNGGTDPLAQTS